jgi:hypothetical protein
VHNRISEVRIGRKGNLQDQKTQLTFFLSAAILPYPVGLPTLGNSPAFTGILSDIDHTFFCVLFLKNTLCWENMAPLSKNVCIPKET